MARARRPPTTATSPGTAAAPAATASPGSGKASAAAPAATASSASGKASAATASSRSRKTSAVAPAAMASSGSGKSSAASTPTPLRMAPPAAPGKRKVTFASDSPTKPIDRSCLFELFVSKKQRALCVTVQEHLNDEPVLKTVMVPGSVKPHQIVRGANRSCSKGIVKWIIKLKKAGWSLDGAFDGSHFYVTPLGTIKMCKTRMQYLVPASKSTTKSDMRAVADAIFCSVFLSCPDLPHENKHLLFLLRRFKDKYMPLLENHPSGMTDVEKLSLFSLLYLRLDMLKTEDREKYSEIAARMPHCKPGKLHWMLGSHRTAIWSPHCITRIHQARSLWCLFLLQEPISLGAPVPNPGGLDTSHMVLAC